MSVVSVKCPNCGATIQLDNERTEGFCSYCGSKVKVEEAQKLMIQGTVKVDTSDELANLYQIARRAKDSNNSENAKKYYDMILVKDPNSWEATFFVTYYQSMQCTIAHIWSAANAMINCEQFVLKLIKEHLNGEQQNDAINEVFVRLSSISAMLANAARKHYDGIDVRIQTNYIQEYCNNASASADIMYNIGNLLITIFGDKYGKIAALSWKNGIEIHKQYIGFLQDKHGNVEIINTYVSKIKKYNTSFEKPIIDTSKPGGCYVATSIYGSYDCPEVWTLRRFRDNFLAKTWYGRIFIKGYYMMSPIIVKWFGEKVWFKDMWKPILDNMVQKLKVKGFDSTPYNDNI